MIPGVTQAENIAIKAFRETPPIRNIIFARIFLPWTRASGANKPNRTPIRPSGPAAAIALPPVPTKESSPPQSTVAIVNKTPTTLHQLSAPPETLEKLLEASGKLFEKWRYMYEETVSEAPLEQMFHAFAALRDGL